MPREIDKFAKTEPFMESNEVDQLGEKAGLDISPEEELALKDKLEERDKERLNLDDLDAQTRDTKSV